MVMLRCGSQALPPLHLCILGKVISKVGVCMQGRDDIGRPLLQRAYDIQNKALGPNHPDVLAIADVLNSEDD